MYFAYRRLATNNSLFPVSLALLLLSFALLLKGTIQFFAPGAGQDFWYRWSAQQYVAAHIDPFRVAFYASDNAQALPPDIPRQLAEYAGNPVSVVDPPWVFAFSAPLHAASRPLAPIAFVSFQYVALVVAILCTRVISRPLAPGQTVLLISLFLANQAFGETILNGNLGIFTLAAIACYFALQRRSVWLASGTALAVAQLKTTIGAPLVLVALVERKILSVGTAAAILLLATSWTRFTLGIDYAGLFQRMLDGVGRYSVGGLSPHKGLMLLGLDKNLSIATSGILILAIAAILEWRWRRDSIAQMGIFAVCSRVFTYHLVIDNVVMAFLVMAMAITWIESGMAPRAGIILGGLVVSLLLPARLTEITAVGIGQQLFWLVALAVLLHARRGRAVAPATTAHLGHSPHAQAAT